MARIYDPRVEAPAYLKISKVVAWLMYAWVIFGIIVLVLRVFLLAFSANTTAGFFQFIMNTSSQYLGPFRGIFPAQKVGTTGYLDVSALFAIIVYIFIAWIFSVLTSYIQDRINLSKEAQLAAIEDAPTRKTVARPARTSRVRA